MHYLLCLPQSLTPIFVNFKRKTSILALLGLLWGCSVPGFHPSSTTWKTYKNSRYDFEFPYPSNWNALLPPGNNDGIIFVAPQKDVEMRGWAGNRLPESISTAKVKTKTNTNFKTAQGVSGVLMVEVGQEVSSMTLTLSRERVKYYWQGRSKSQDFQNYYRLFYYIAQQYRIPT
jgi:hypothetical protein